MFWVIVLLEDPVTTQFQFSGRGSQIKMEKVLVFQAVHDAMHPNKVPRAFRGKKKKTQHHRTSTIVTYRLFLG